MRRSYITRAAWQHGSMAVETSEKVAGCNAGLEVQIPPHRGIKTYASRSMGVIINCVGPLDPGTRALLDGNVGIRREQGRRSSPRLIHRLVQAQLCVHRFEYGTNFICKSF